MMSHSAYAQAWLPEKGSLILDFDHTFSRSSDIIYENEVGFPDVPVSNHVSVFGISYSPLESLQLEASIPFLGVKTRLEDSNAISLGSNDTGEYHFTTEDLRISARYQIPIDFLAASVFLQGSLPTTDYEVNGNAGIARGLKAATAGAHVGKFFPFENEKINGVFFQLGGSFALVEKFDTDWEETSRIGQNFVESSFALGLLTFGRLGITGGVDFRLSLDGVSFTDFANGNLTPIESNFYNPLLKEWFLLSLIHI